MAAKAKKKKGGLARGIFRGENRLMDPETNAPDVSKATCRVVPVMGGRFVRLDYTWSWRKKKQEGSMLVGHDDDAAEVTIDWIDSWHMGGKVMHLRGAKGAGRTDVRGTYRAPPGPDWGWRIAIEAAASKLRIVMHNVTPDGEEQLAMTTTLRKA
jgi:hypothetical protein